MADQDPYAIPEPEQPPGPEPPAELETPPAPESPPIGSIDLDFAGPVEFEVFAPPAADKGAWDELRSYYEHNQTARLQKQKAVWFPETPELQDTKRRRVRVISQKQTHIQQMMGMGLEHGAPMLPPAEETLAYDIRPGENEDQAFQRAMEAYRALDGQGLQHQIQEEIGATKYVAARSASQMTLGGSSVLWTQGFERRYRESHPNDVAALEGLATAATVVNPLSFSKYMPMNVVFNIPRTAAIRVGRNMILQAGARAGDALKPLTLKVAGMMGNTVQDFLQSAGGREMMQYARPKTVEEFYDAWGKVSAAFSDDAIRIGKDVASENIDKFVVAFRALKSELKIAGHNLAAFRILKVGGSAAGGGAVGGTEATVRALWADTPEEREHARTSIFPQIGRGIFVGGAFGAVEAAYNAIGTHAVTPKAAAPMPPAAAIPRTELQRMRARQLERHIK